jgi:Flp pilus assembly protein CpaB
MNALRAAAFAAACLLLGACRASNSSEAESGGAALAPPTGKRAVSLTLDKSQTEFLSPGDVAEIVVLVETPRPDGGAETRSEVLAGRAEVLRVARDWGEDAGLISVALSPEEAQYASLAADREDRLFLNKLGEGAKLAVWSEPAKPVLAPGQRGLAVLVYSDQQEFLAPGDRVDVIATRRGGKAAGKAELAAVTMFQDVLVLGVRAAEGKEEWSTVQLMLDEKQSRELTRSVAAEDNLVLAARSPDDHATRPVAPAKMSRKFGTEAERASPKS